MSNSVFIDTSFIIAILNPNDRYNEIAKTHVTGLFSDHNRRVWTSEAILYELGNAFAKANKDVVARFIRNFERSPNCTIVWGNETLFQEALSLYSHHQDKKWSLTDCLSFIIMKENGIQIAYSSDHHFKQAGFHYILQ